MCVCVVKFITVHNRQSTTKTQEHTRTSTQMNALTQAERSRVKYDAMRAARELGSILDTPTPSKFDRDKDVSRLASAQTDQEQSLVSKHHASATMSAEPQDLNWMYQEREERPHAPRPPISSSHYHSTNLEPLVVDQESRWGANCRDQDTGGVMRTSLVNDSIAGSIASDHGQAHGALRAVSTLTEIAPSQRDPKRDTKGTWPGGLPPVLPPSFARKRLLGKFTTLELRGETNFTRFHTRLPQKNGMDTSPPGSGERRLVLASGRC